MKMTPPPESFPGIERRREGANGVIVDKITVKSTFLGTLSNAHADHPKGTSYRDATREGQLLVPRTQRTTSSTSRPCETSCSGWLPGPMGELLQKYVDWKVRPRRQMVRFPSTRSTLRSSPGGQGE